MDIFLTCPECRKELLLPEKMLNKYVKCPECQGAFYAEPRLAPVAVALPAPRPAPREADEKPRRLRHDRHPLDVRLAKAEPRPLPYRAAPWYVWCVAAFPLVVAVVIGSYFQLGLAAVLSFVGLGICMGRWRVGDRLLVLLSMNGVIYGLMLVAYLVSPPAQDPRNRSLAIPPIQQRFPNAFVQVPPRPPEPPPATQFAGLVGYWSFDEVGPDGEVRDLSGRGNHGKLRGVGVRLVDGMRGKAVHFSGDGRFDYGASREFNFPTNGSFTIAFWVRTQNQDVTLVAQRPGIAAHGSIEISLWEGRLWAAVRHDGAPIPHKVGAGTVVADGDWHHCAVVRKQFGHVALYVNGEFEVDLAGANADGVITTVQRVVAPPHPPPGPGEIVPEPTEMTVDELCVYNRILGDKEIRQLSGR